MIYDTVIIGAGLAGFTSAITLAWMGKKVIIIAKGLGSLYYSSGYIDLIGYYPSESLTPVIDTGEILKKMISEKPDHPYAKVGFEINKEAFEFFQKITKKMNMPYEGSFDRNTLMPTAIGSFVPTGLYPEHVKNNIFKTDTITVAGIKELMDFFPNYVAENLKRQLKKDIKHLWVETGINIHRELNSYDIAIALEDNIIREKFINELKPHIEEKSLLLIPAVLGAGKWKKVISHIEESLKCKTLEIPTLPPSVMGFRLGETLLKYLKSKAIEIIIGYPVEHIKCNKGICESISISTASGRLKEIKGKNYILATGGILGEGLMVYPKEIKEQVFNLPVAYPEKPYNEDFFDLKGHSLFSAGIKVNNKLQSVNPDNNNIIFHNLFVAGATLSGYDPFLEKSGNGVAITTGYKAALMTIEGENHE